jgi:type I restriction enzyme S subunit
MDNWVFIPKIEEQKIIVNHIKSEFKILDETISKIEKEIALVEEYKTALIAEAVTGKIDVRGYEVPEISEEETYEDLEEEISITSEDAEAYQTVEE